MKNNIGYADYTDNTKDVTKELEGLKTLPPGIYEYDNLGLLMKEMEKKDINIDDTTLQSLKGFIVVSHHDIKTKYEIIVTNNTSLKDHIFYAYYKENTNKFVLVATTSGGSGLITSIDKLDNLEKDTVPFYDDITEHNFLTYGFVNYTFLPYYFKYGECNENIVGQYNETGYNDQHMNYRLHGPSEKKDTRVFFLGTAMLDIDDII